MARQLISPVPLISAPTKQACGGKYVNADQLDAFQFFNADGSIDFHINARGIIDPPVYPQISYTLLETEDLLNLHSTPVTLVPAVAPGTIIFPQYFSAQLIFGGTPFDISNSGAGNTYIYYPLIGVNDGDTVFASMADSADSEGMDYTASSSQFYSNGTVTPSSFPISEMDNQPLVMIMDDTLSVGNGNMLVTLSYVISVVNPID
jgi:hypothetical protein